MHQIILTNDFKIMIIYGSAGTGKTSSTNVLTRKIYGIKAQTHIFNLNASDFRNWNQIKDLLIESNFYLNEKKLKPILILEEADGMPMKTQINLLNEITKNNLEVKLILTCNDIEACLPELLNISLNFHFKKINLQDMVKRLKKILDLEKILYSENALFCIAEKCDGDLRMGINYVESIAVFYGDINNENYKKHFNNFNPLKNLDFLKFCKKKDFNGMLEVIDYILEEGYCYNEMLIFLYEIIIVKDKERSLDQNNHNFTNEEITHLESFNFEENIRSDILRFIFQENKISYINTVKYYGFCAEIFKIFNKY